MEYPSVSGNVFTSAFRVMKQIYQDCMMDYHRVIRDSVLDPFPLALTTIHHSNHYSKTVCPLPTCKFFYFKRKSLYILTFLSLLFPVQCVAFNLEK